MEDDYGKRMGCALRAVLQMHSDSSRLLRDLDRHMPGYRTPFERNTVTANQTNSVLSSRFMAQGLFRLYVRSKVETDAIGINICFFDDEHIPAKFDEPLFIAAKLTYPTTSISDRGEWFWDPWTALIHCGVAKAMTNAVELGDFASSSGATSATVFAVPLFSIADESTALTVVRSVNPEIPSI